MHAATPYERASASTSRPTGREAREAPNRRVVEAHLRGKRTLEDVQRITSSNIRNGEWQDGLACLRQLWDAGITPNVYNYTDAMNACRKADRPDEVIELFSEMQRSGVQPDLAAYSTVISACGTARRPADPLQYFQEMRNAGIAPDERSLSCLIAALGRLKRFDDAMKAFDETLPQAGIKPGVEAYAAAVAACNEGGRAEKACQLYDRMRQQELQPDHRVYTHLITACVKGGKEDLVPGLLADAVAGNAFHESLGYTKLGHANDKRYFNTLNFHDKCLVNAPATDRGDRVSGALAMALVDHHLDTGHIDRHTVFIVGGGGGVIKDAVQQRLTARGCVPEEVPGNPGRLRIKEWQRP